VGVDPAGLAGFGGGGVGEEACGGYWTGRHGVSLPKRQGPGISE
jgi:hypothetical protein